MADAAVAAEPSSELAENLLLKLEVEWYKQCGDVEPVDPFQALASFSSILATRKDLRDEISYYGFISINFQHIMALIASEKLGSVSIEMRQQLVQDGRHDEPKTVYSVRAWSDLGNSRYANWFRQCVAHRMQEPITLNEEHLGDIVEAALAIELLRERTGYKAKTRFDKFPTFYAMMAHTIEAW